MHHGAGLRALTGSTSLPRALVLDYRSAGVSPADGAMLDYAVALTVAPGTMHADGVETLRGTGFDDTAILDICQVVAYYNYVNRIADGLGVELEASWKDEDLIVSKAEFEDARGRVRAAFHERSGGADGMGPSGAGLDG